MDDRIRLPVRKIVETVLRCGDIDSRYTDSSAMLDGAKAHRKIQKGMGADYKREVSLKLDVDIGGVPATVYGRADGVIIASDGVTIDEIKTTTLPLEKIYEQRELHLGQAKCYAHMLLQSLEDAASLSIQLTYYQLETEELSRYVYAFTREEIASFFERLMLDYGVWLRFERDWRETRDKSIKKTVFPFPAYRRGQRELAVAAYRAIEKGKKLYVQAPTGIGKTLSALFPSVKAMGGGIAEKMFYLTAKTVTRAVAEDAVTLMAEKGLRLKSITLRAKEKICFQDETICTPDFCPYARGHYDRINDAILDILGENDLITPSLVERYAEKHRVCPYEYALDIALWVDLVICDYNHVFDPVVYLRRFFADGGGDYVFLVDEAHNLLERVRDMYTVALKKSDFYRLKAALKDKNPPAAKLRRAMNAINTYLLDIRKTQEDKDAVVSESLDDGLLKLVGKFTLAAEEWLAAEKHGAHPLQKDVLALFFEASFFIGISERYDSHYVSIIEINGSDVCMTLFCLDPSDIIAEKLLLAKASVIFSATLTPLPYYKEMLGGAENDVAIALPSPFEQERLLLIAHTGISTKYVDRDASIKPIAAAIYAATSKKRGNYMVYFPSYEYMRKVYECVRLQDEEAEFLVQEQSMGDEERALFLKRFDSKNTGRLIGFCVLGGVFSEGIDLKGDRLIGTVIVGVGLPKLSLRQDLIRGYFDKKSGSGYDYAYVYPGMNKVLQAVGRVIRTESDYGAALLIDSRFGNGKYRALFPVHWSHMRFFRELGELNILLNKFIFFK